MNPARPRHISVLGREAVALLKPRDGGIYIDATFGAGGYSRAILEAPGARVIGIDRDRTAILAGFDLVDRSGGRLTLVEDRFSNLAEICAAQGVDPVDGVVMDVGVSSMQLDKAARGFSFRLDGPLDMRMGHGGPTAADVIAKRMRGRSRQRHLYLRRGAAFARRCARDRRRAQGHPDHDDARAGRHRRQSRARQARRHSSGDADVPGVAHFRQRGTRRAASGAVGGGTRAEAGRPAGGCVVSFAGRPHRQEFSQSNAARSAADRGTSRRPRRPRRVFVILTKRPVTAGRRRDFSATRAHAPQNCGRPNAPMRPRTAPRHLPAWPTLDRRDEGRLTMRLIHLLVISAWCSRPLTSIASRWSRPRAPSASCGCMRKCASSATRSRC